MIDLKEYGFRDEMLSGDVKGLPARIIAVHRERIDVICEKGELPAKLKTSVYYNGSTEVIPTVGDFVLLNYNEEGYSYIIKTLPQKTTFIRSDYKGHLVGYAKHISSQAVASNFDYVFILSSLNANFNISRIERYLVLSRQTGAIPVVVLTKLDLVEDTTEQIQQVKKIAKKSPVIAISSKTGAGVDKLSNMLKKGDTVVFLGSSGVGKSSLVNCLANREVMAVKEIREEDSKGRHTTTHRQMIMLDSGLMIIDTPGMRELGVWQVDDGFNETFEDIEQLITQCRFSDCKHETEPSCAIKKALESGELDIKHWQNYQSINSEKKLVDDKAISKLQKAIKKDKNK